MPENSAPRGVLPDRMLDPNDPCSVCTSKGEGVDEICSDILLERKKKPLFSKRVAAPTCSQFITQKHPHLPRCVRGVPLELPGTTTPPNNGDSPPDDPHRPPHACCCCRDAAPCRRTPLRRDPGSRQLATGGEGCGMGHAVGPTDSLCGWRHPNEPLNRHPKKTSPFFNQKHT